MGFWWGRYLGNGEKGLKQGACIVLHSEIKIVSHGISRGTSRGASHGGALAVDVMHRSSPSIRSKRVLDEYGAFNQVAVHDQVGMPAC